MFGSLLIAAIIPVSIFAYLAFGTILIVTLARLLLYGNGGDEKVCDVISEPIDWIMMVILVLSWPFILAALALLTVVSHVLAIFTDCETWP